MNALKTLCFTVAAAALAGCASMTGGGGWVTLLDGEKGMENFDRTGDANWRAEGGTIMADDGKGGYLVTKTPYTNFEIRAEFFASTDTNSGIFIRAQDAKTIAAATAYEVNIWDIRPEPKYGSGAVVDFAEVPVPLTNLVGGKWNVLEIKAVGPRMVVMLNGLKTVDFENSKFAAGPFALQYGAGVKAARGGPIKWRKVQVRTL
jgi:Domain of Unknown Function (DUF1080)